MLDWTGSDTTVTGLVNTHTNTVHKPAQQRTHRATVCGALQHVLDGQIARLATTEAEIIEQASVQRCGRCFDDAGGY